MSDTVNRNADFLFLYEAINANPNGDPDQENKPRMDYDTRTNLVTDVRIKRFIRDYLRNNGKKIFVDMEGDSKVSMDSRMKTVVNQLVKDEVFLAAAFKDAPERREELDKTLKKAGDKSPFEALQALKDYTVNKYILVELVKREFVDVRMFGSAFAVKGFTKAYTGPVQMNWGYSLNRVELVDSNSIVTVMSDEHSTFGKDYRVHYSLLAFTGTVNKHAAQTTGLTDEDVAVFRDAIWKAIPAVPTRSKGNQYPKLYLEIVYKDGVSNGQFGDLRQFIDVKTKDGLEEKKVRKYDDLELDFSKLNSVIADNKDKIEKVLGVTAPDVSIDVPFESISV
jgi:CRISPR-associated protein Csh2